MNSQSAYELIKANIETSGKLPHTFTLEESRAPNQLSFAPGAMDGVGIYHMGAGDEKKAVKEITNLLRKYFKSGNEKYIAKIEALLVDNRVISLIDPICKTFVMAARALTPALCLMQGCTSLRQAVILR